MTPLRILGHLLRGRTTLWQLYTNVHWRTCEACLALHGRIAPRPDGFPRDGCPHEARPFPVWRLREHRELGARMAARAEAELRRRALVRQARALLATDPEGALRLLDEAGKVDVYLPEVEDLARDPALADPALRARVRTVLLARWKGKFAHERYERQPELARTEQERWGVRRIEELLA
ncbi:MAG: hypothetical protein N2320_04250 [Candidatus Bipolaricaulota bacterium]|nr:hypothetical protein [Candidatus Bipolaricaulota bacterium]